METNKIKSFAKEARLLFLDGVLQRLKYWGFSADGSNDQDLQSTQGGYIFRGQIYTDSAVPSKWKALKTRLKDKQAVQDLLEEASYTWFNRLMAIKILEVNGYLEPTLSFTEGMRTPLIVQNAKKGIQSLRSQADKDLLLEYLQEDKEEQAFGLLIANLCNRNKLLHDIFGRIDDYTEILLPQNLLQKDGVLDLINSDAISSDDYKEVELIGWLYQFYISDKKDEVFAGFKKNKKARAEDIPAATQIFTPKWIVKYMVENTVGKIYLDYEPTSSLKESMKYLVQNDSDKAVTSSGVEKKAIISDITELTLIDPASGSGHILVTGFELLFKMYREEGYTAKQAVDNILEHNLFGLDIDDRAMQLARFAVLLKAAQFDADVLNRGIIPHVYSFPEASNFTSEELQNFLGHDGHQFTAELKEALQLLNQGKNIGSALKLELSEEAQNHIKNQYEDWLQKDKIAGGLDALETGLWNRLASFLDVLLVLTKKYASVVANPPYLKQQNMNAILKSYIVDNYPQSKTDLFSVFIDLCLNLKAEHALAGMITQHSWMFLSSFEELRFNILENFSISSMLHLGPRTFEELSGEVVQSTAFILTDDKYKKGDYYRLVNYRDNKSKEIAFLNGQNYYRNVSKSNFSTIPGNRIGYWFSDLFLTVFVNDTLGKLYEPKSGVLTGKDPLFVRNWYEASSKKIGFDILNHEDMVAKNFKWIPITNGGSFRKWYGNLYNIANLENNGYDIRNLKNNNHRLRNPIYYFQHGINWTLFMSGKFCVRESPIGVLFGNGSRTFFPSESDFKYLSCLFNSVVATQILELYNPTTNFVNEDISSVPIVYIDNKVTINELYNSVYLISKNDWNTRETSWDFEKTSLLNDSVSLSQAYSKWYEQACEDFFQLHANEEELNRIFIDIYGLQEELTPEVTLKDITILQEELDRNALEALEPVFREQGAAAVSLPINKAEVISQFLSYGIGVFLGRYRLDKPGLNIAHPNPTEEELCKYSYNGHNIEIDEDGILPLMGEDCAFPDDALVRTKDLVHAVWGEDSLTENINFIHDGLGMDLHKWLTEKFWGYHTSMYKKKPIYWLFSSNVKKPQNAAFKVLVYMHRMDKYTVQKIQRNYLHPHQEYIKREIVKLSDNEENLSKQEMKRLEQLRNHELECRDYNEVLKELANQQIEFDLDDGVDTNYAKFEGAVAKI